MINIRTAVRKELPLIDSLNREGFAEGLVLKRSKKDLKALIKNENIFVAVKDNKEFVGMVTLDFYSKRLSELRSIYIKENFRKSGVGKKLLDAVFEKAKRMRIKEIMVITSKELRRWFSKSGFNNKPHKFKIALFKKL
ncbi:MAG: GNAT family N-acetyltransferase [Candidatus Diapherotrites archaeon]|nr:GNAT family N-acetyltransferase [Candidatus Diapherotrites archaeon]